MLHTIIFRFSLVLCRINPWRLARGWFPPPFKVISGPNAEITNTPPTFLPSPPLPCSLEVTRFRDGVDFLARVVPGTFECFKKSLNLIDMHGQSNFEVDKNALHASVNTYIESKKKKRKKNIYIYI